MPRLKKSDLKKTAYREAGALLRDDMDSADLACDKTLSEEDAGFVREFIRTRIAVALEKRGK
jgi:hypothetical protein